MSTNTMHYTIDVKSTRTLYRKNTLINSNKNLANKSDSINNQKKYGLNEKK